MKSLKGLLTPRGERESNDASSFDLVSPRRFLQRGKSMSVPVMIREEEDFSFLRGEAPKPRKKPTDVTNGTTPQTNEASTNDTTDGTLATKSAGPPVAIPVLNLSSITNQASSEDTPRTRLRKSSIFHQSLRLSGRSRATSSARLREVAQQQVVKASDYQFNFHFILQNRETCQEFLKYLRSTATDEGLLFMMAVDELVQRVIHENVMNQTHHFTPDEQAKNDLTIMKELYATTKKIYDDFIVPKSFNEINIAGEIRNNIYLDMQHLQNYFERSGNNTARVSTSSPSSKQSSNKQNAESANVDLESFRFIFKTAYNSVRVNLESDSFVRFTRSPGWDSYFSKNFVRLCSMNRGLAIHRSKIQVKQMNRTDFIREFITGRDLQFGLSLASSSQFWTCVYEKQELNNLKVYHSGQENILDRKAYEVYGAMPVIKQECIFTCSHHELIRLISSEQYGSLIGFLGTDISTAITRKRPVNYTKQWYARSTEREQRVQTSRSHRPISRSDDSYFIKDLNGDRVFNTGSFVCEVPMPGLHKRRQLSQCSTTLFDGERKSYYRISKPIVTPEGAKNTKCSIVYAFSFIQIQEIAEGSCRFTQYVSSNGNAITGRLQTSSGSIDSKTARDTEEEIEETGKVINPVKIATKVKQGAKKTVDILNFALWDYYLNRPKLTDLCYMSQCLKDNTREEEDENQRLEKIKSEERRRTGSFFEGLLSKLGRIRSSSTQISKPDDNLLTALTAPSLRQTGSVPSPASVYLLSS